MTMPLFVLADGSVADRLFFGRYSEILDYHNVDDESNNPAMEGHQNGN